MRTRWFICPEHNIRFVDCAERILRGGEGALSVSKISDPAQASIDLCLAKGVRYFNYVGSASVVLCKQYNRRAVSLYFCGKMRVANTNRRNLGLKPLSVYHAALPKVLIGKIDTSLHKLRTQSTASVLIRIIPFGQHRGTKNR